MENLKNDGLAKAYADYQNNFKWKNGEIKEILTFEEMRDIVKNERFREEIKTNWWLKFYIKQLFLLSFRKVTRASDTNDNIAVQKDMLIELQEMLMYQGDREARGIVFFVKLSLFKKTMTEFELHDIFAGNDFCDDSCAQIAYEELIKRKKK